MKNSADLGGCYPPRPSTSVDNTLPNLQNSSYPTQPHSIISKYSATSRIAKKDWKNNKHDSLHLGRKYARMFVLGHYLFLEAHSFPRATLSENCSLLERDNVCGQISKHIFAPNGGFYLYITVALSQSTLKLRYKTTKKMLQYI